MPKALGNGMVHSETCACTWPWTAYVSRREGESLSVCRYGAAYNWNPQEHLIRRQTSYPPRQRTGL